jgi:Cdc6-like AAA superfamily ATPase
MQIKNANQERETIIGWLSPLDFRPQHQDFIQRREPGTGQRFLNSEHFKKWSTGKHCNLFCPGIPGAGKTIMAATVVDHLETTSEISVDNDIGIIYLYCNYRRQLEQTAPNLLGSLASQLARQRPGLSEELQALYKRHVDKKSRPNIDDLLQLIQVEIGRFSQVFIVLDALDECVNAHDTRKTLASNLRDITQKVPANLLVTSRFIPEATNLFEDCPRLEIRAQAEDVEAYLTAQLERLPKFVMRNLELQNTIVTTVAKAVDGM